MKKTNGWQAALISTALLVFTASTALADITVLVTDFEGTFSEPINVAQVVFREPTFSGSTIGVDLALPSFTFLASSNDFPTFVFPSSGTQALLSSWVWEDPADPTAWVRLSTSGTTDIPTPAVHLAGKVTVWIAATAYTDENLGTQVMGGNLLIGTGIRETGIGVGLGSPGGSTGDIEWVGLSEYAVKIYAGMNLNCDTTADPGSDDVQVNSGPVASELTVCVDAGTNGFFSTSAAGDDFVRSTPVGMSPLPGDGTVRAYTFDLPALETAGNVFGFTGDGALGATPNNRGTLEHLVITNDPANGAVDAQAWVLSIDDVIFESPVIDPPSIIVLPAGPVPLATSVGVEEVSVDATLVEVILQNPLEGDSVIGSTIPGGSTTVNVPTSPLPGGLSLVARQTIGADVSDDSQPVVVVSPGNGPLRFATAIRETDGIDAGLACGADGTGFDPNFPSTLEFVGATSTSAFGVPDGRRISPEFGWRELVFDPCVDGVTAFSGDGIIDVNSTGPTVGVWEGLYYRIDDIAPTTGPYTLYVDDMTLINGSGQGVDCMIDDFDGYTPGEFIVGDFGGDQVCNTTAVGDDVQEVPVNDMVFAGQILVSPGANGILDTAPEGDDGQQPLHARFNFPGVAGTNVGVSGLGDLCQVTSEESFSGANSLEIRWEFENASNLNSVVRHTTNGSIATDPPETLIGPDPVIELTNAACDDGIDIGFSVMILFEPAAIPGDCDFDGDVDLADSACFQRCIGQAATSAPECEQLDTAPNGAPDGTITLDDWELQEILTIGPR